MVPTITDMVFRNKLRGTIQKQSDDKLRETLQERKESIFTNLSTAVNIETAK